MDKERLDKDIATAKAYMIAWKIEYERLLAIKNQK